MKSTRLFITIAVLLLSQNTNAQKFNQRYIGAVSLGGLYPHCMQMLYQFNLSKADSNLSVISYFGDGLDTTIQLNDTQLHAYMIHTYTSRGTYSIKSVMYKKNTPIDSIFTSCIINCNTVMIRSYMSTDTNCTYDYLTEKKLNIPTQIEIDSAGTIIDTITVVGSRIYTTSPNTKYTFRELSPPTGTSFACSSNGIDTVTAPLSGFGRFIDFGHDCVSSNQFDLDVTLMGMFRPVNTSRLIVHVKNKGCGSKNATLTVNLSNKYSYKSATPAPTGVNGNTLIWNLVNLSNTNSETIYIYADTATTLSLNDTVCNYAIITPVSGDVNTTNNSVTTCSEVRASWDPNDKSVSPHAEIAPGISTLTYTINFENLGSDTAFNIHILDTLSDNLDASTFKVISASHSMDAIFVKNNINKNIIKFNFADIRLADSNSKEHNKGFVIFKINTKRLLTDGTLVQNRAGIYFDINPVVLTGYATNNVSILGISKAVTTHNITLYPNPVTNTLTIQTNNNEYQSLKIFNNMGQVVAEQNINSSNMQVNMKHLPTGVYYIQLQGAANIVTRKVEKL